MSGDLSGPAGSQFEGPSHLTVFPTKCNPTQQTSFNCRVPESKADLFGVYDGGQAAPEGLGEAER